MGTYRHDWDLGTMSPTVTTLKAMSILQSCPNRIFPFAVRGKANETVIKLGSFYDLLNTTGPLNALGTRPDPVEVTALSDKSFTFLTLKGHHRGSGQTITFETYEKLTSDGSKMLMHVYLTRIIHRTARNRPRPPNTWARDFIAKNFIKQPIRIVVNDINGLALTAHFS